MRGPASDGGFWPSGTLLVTPPSRRWQRRANGEWRDRKRFERVGSVGVDVQAASAGDEVDDEADEGPFGYRLSYSVQGQNEGD